MRLFSRLSGHTLVKGGLATSATTRNSCNGRHCEDGYELYVVLTKVCDPVQTRTRLTAAL
jgi:hypothetical protein